MILHRIQSLNAGGFVVCLTVRIGGIVGGGHCFNRIEEIAALFQIVLLDVRCLFEFS